MNYPKKNIGFALIDPKKEGAPLSSRLQIINKEIAPLAKGQVLVEMVASPINPSDLVNLTGHYGLRTAAGQYVGFEGCGIVKAANAGLYGRWLVGRRVALSAQPGQDGLWAKYAVTRANLCLAVKRTLSEETCASLIVNPCTALCLVARAQALGARGIVLNAAASQVGKNVIRYAKMKGLATIAILRHPAQSKALLALGCDAVLHNQSPDFADALSRLSHKLGASVLLDAVTEAATSEALSAMPKGSTAIIYGRLANSKGVLGGQFNPSDIIFNNHKIEGFWLANHVKTMSPLALMKMSMTVQGLFAKSQFKTDILGRYAAAEFIDALMHYSQHKSDGKVLLNCQSFE